MTPLFGHIKQQKWLISSDVEARLHHGIILAGRRGLGKFLFAQHAAAMLLSRSTQDTGKLKTGKFLLADHVEPQADRMVSHNQHPDLHIIERGPKNDVERKKAEKGGPYERKRNISVDQIRNLQKRFTTRPTLGDRRIIIIDAADNLERGAANALLKSLEEPAENTHFFLISHNPGKLLPTIRSRCQILNFGVLTDTEMSAVLRYHIDDLDDTALQSLLTNGNGVPADMLAFQNNMLSDILLVAKQIVTQGDKDQQLRTRLASDLAKIGNLEQIIAVLRTFPPLLAERARTTQGPVRQSALNSWSALRNLLDTASVYNYDHQALIFHIAGLLAAPAQIRDEQS